MRGATGETTGDGASGDPPAASASGAGDSDPEEDYVAPVGDRLGGEAAGPVESGAVAGPGESDAGQPGEVGSGARISVRHASSGGWRGATPSLS